MADEIYLNLLDWGTHNVVAIALKERLSLHIVDLDKQDAGYISDDHDQIISSVAWSPEGLEIAIGLKNSVVHLWDPYTQQQVCYSGYFER